MSQYSYCEYFGGGTYICMSIAWQMRIFGWWYPHPHQWGTGYGMAVIRTTPTMALIKRIKSRILTTKIVTNLLEIGVLPILRSTYNDRA